MKTDLNSRSSLFKKSKVVVHKIDQDIEKAANEDYTDVDDLLDRVQEAIAKRDEESLRWLQLEVQTRTMVFLKIIDWKMWEIYNKFVR